MKPSEILADVFDQFVYGVLALAALMVVTLGVYTTVAVVRVAVTNSVDRAVNRAFWPTDPFYSIKPYKVERSTGPGDFYWDEGYWKNQREKEQTKRPGPEAGLRMVVTKYTSEYFAYAEGKPADGYVLETVTKAGIKKVELEEALSIDLAMSKFDIETNGDLAAKYTCWGTIGGVRAYVLWTINWEHN